MKCSDVARFFEGDISPLDLKNTIEAEGRQFESALKKRGGSAPIYLTEDLESPYTITRDHFKELCHGYLQNIFEEIHLNYIADAVIMSENFYFQNEEINDLFLGISDPVLNGPLNTEYINSLLRD
jgi:hypothetical protein